MSCCFCSFSIGFFLVVRFQCNCSWLVTSLCHWYFVKKAHPKTKYKKNYKSQKPGRFVLKNILYIYCNEFYEQIGWKFVSIFRIILSSFLLKFEYKNRSRKIYKISKSKSTRVVSSAGKIWKMVHNLLLVFDLFQLNKCAIWS